jgi:hypothetical protein
MWGEHSRSRAPLTIDHIVNQLGRNLRWPSHMVKGWHMRERLLDPTGDSERAINTTLAPRPQSLQGLTVGLLDNTKPNGVVVLRAVGRELRERYGVREIRMFQKGYFGTPVEESVVNQMLRNCDFAVAAIGD